MKKGIHVVLQVSTDGIKVLDEKERVSFTFLRYMLFELFINRCMKKMVSSGTLNKFDHQTQMRLGQMLFFPYSSVDV